MCYLNPKLLCPTRELLGLGCSSLTLASLCQLRTPEDEWRCRKPLPLSAYQSKRDEVQGSLTELNMVLTDEMFIGARLYTGPCKCHSPQTASAGLAVVEAMRRSGRGFEQRTLRGPGTGNKGWTALHMACAYGVEPLVVALCAAGYAKCQRLQLNLSSSVLP